MMSQKYEKNVTYQNEMQCTPLQLYMNSGSRACRTHQYQLELMIAL